MNALSPEESEDGREGLRADHHSRLKLKFNMEPQIFLSVKLRLSPEELNLN